MLYCRWLIFRTVANLLGFWRFCPQEFQTLQMIHYLERRIQAEIEARAKQAVVKESCQCPKCQVARARVN